MPEITPPLLAALAVTLASACVTTSAGAPVRLAVGSTFSCFACADQPVCQTYVPHRRQITLPGAEGLAWTDLRRIAAGSEGVCALLGSNLHCWTYSLDEGRFSGPTVEPNVADFDLENRALCMTSRRGDLRCVGEARAQADPRELPLDLTPGRSSRDVDVTRTEREGRIEEVALSYAGACHRDSDGRATCWRWDGTSPEFSTSSDLRVLKLWPVTDGIELWTETGVFKVSIYLSGWTVPLEAVAVEPELPPKSWIHGHAAACRVLDDGEIECRVTLQQDAGEALFGGWQTPPQCPAIP